MYLAYIAESGKATWFEKGDHVISALIIKQTEKERLMQEYNEFSSKFAKDYNFDPEKLVLTAKDLVFGRKEFGPWKLDDRRDMIQRVVDFISSLDCELVEVKFETDMIYQKNLKHKYLNRWMENWTYTLLLEKVSSYVGLKEDKNQKIKMILNDINPQFNEYKLNLFNRIIEKDKNRETGTYILEDLIEGYEFEEKSQSPLMQLSGFCAWIVRRYYYTVIPEKPYDLLAHEHFEKIADKFATKPNGRPEGLGIKLFPIDFETSSYKDSRAAIAPKSASFGLIDPEEPISDKLEYDPEDKELLDTEFKKDFDEEFDRMEEIEEE